MLRWRLIQLAVVAVALVGCASVPSTNNGPAALLRGSQFQVQERLLAKIPVGTSRAEAERQVTALGLERVPVAAWDTSSADSIQCRHTVKGLLQQTTWLIQIECPHGQVSEIFCEQIKISNW